MTPPARLQAAIDLVDQISAAAQSNGAAADTLIARWFAARRYAGSKDRPAIRDLVYRAVRRFGDPPISGRAAFATLADDDAELAALFDGSPYGPAPLTADEPRAVGDLLPSWLVAQIDAQDRDGLLDRAPLDLRANRVITTRDGLLEVWPDGKPIAGLENGIRFSTPFAIENAPEWLAGLVEVQDAGSQWVVEACRAVPGMTIVDLCAGAGGKTLALAAATGGDGRIVACDIDRQRLAKLGPRALRGGTKVETRLLDSGREAEQLDDLASAANIVLVDAPCSGSGTLRRNPEARWRLNAARLERLLDQQRRVLDLAVPLVRPGGHLIYAVCSLIAQEGANQVEAFLRRHDGWAAEPVLEVGRPTGGGRLLSPANDGTDGFFVARLVAPC